MYKYLLDFIYGYKKYIITSVILYLTFSFLSSLTPIITKNFINYALINLSQEYLNKLIFIFIFIIILVILTGFISNKILIFTFQEIKTGVKYNLYKKICNSQYEFINKTPSGEIVYRILNEANCIEQILNLIFISLPIDLLIITFLTFVSLYWNYKLTIVILMIFLIQILIINKFRKKIFKYAISQQQQNQFLSGLITECINDLSFIHGINMNNKVNVKLYECFNEVKKVNVKYANLLALSSLISILMNNIWILIILWYGGFLVINNKMSIGELMAFFMIFNMIYPKMKSIFDNILSYQSTKVSFLRIIEYYKLKENNEYKSEGSKFTNGTIYIKNLNFSYCDQRIVFKNFNAKINSNSVTALIGLNGAGKSTLCKLISRLINIENNKIYIDDTDINFVDSMYLKENIIYQPQDKFLINGTILENIVCNKKIDFDRLTDVLKKVDLLDFINNLPQKLNTNVSNSSNNLSLGQAQKIALARIYYNVPKIIILDEPTAFLDQGAITLFNDIIHQLKEKSTILIVAHNKETIEKSDYIIKL